MTSVKSMKSITTTTDEPPLSQSCCEQYLFLLELYVCQIKSNRLAKLNQCFCVPTTVEFSFLKFKKDKSLRLTPVDPMFEPLSAFAEDAEPFYAGKSVLFALDSGVVASAYGSDFVIRLDVQKKMPDNVKPDVWVGKAEIDMSLHFAALSKEIIDSFKYTAAEIPSPSKTFDGEVPLSWCGEDCGSIDVYARISGYGQTVVTEFGAPRLDASVSSFLFAADDCGNRVPRYKCHVLDPDACRLSDVSSSQECKVCKPPKLPCAPCRVGSGAIVAVGKAAKREAPPPAAASAYTKTICSPIQTSRGPKEPCGKAVVLKVSGLLNNACSDDPCKPSEPRVTVAPESEALNPADLNSDPDHDVFILRIGKKGLVGADEKSDIQLEMRTPKGPERRPPVRLETREMQTEEDSGKKGAAGKGKKKK
ncbi:uncharacterized protein LOC131669671 [Phymastichus coffea]|uniref:uncharacterized protein LOC131669671 n=1 Tax=Phymastichus coffea TaxID=108790 RepID=UPI00273C3BB9|nr:uncharacterized protein LOC131669671 [Phymastichus coffea]